MIRSAVIFALVPCDAPMSKAIFIEDRDLADDMMRNSTEEQPLELWEPRRVCG